MIRNNFCDDECHIITINFLLVATKTIIKIITTFSVLSNQWYFHLDISRLVAILVIIRYWIWVLHLRQEKKKENYSNVKKFPASKNNFIWIIIIKSISRKVLNYSMHLDIHNIHLWWKFYGNTRIILLVFNNLWNFPKIRIKSLALR